MSDRLPDVFTTKQLEALGYLTDGSGARHDRPLLICDVDEVVLHLVDPFATLLGERGFELKTHSFKLTGNVFHIADKREATQEEVWATLEQLFEEQGRRQHLVEGVIEGLDRIAAENDVLFLTNMPHTFRDTRIAHLVENGIHHPLVTNAGSKVPAIDIVKRHRHGPVGFIDDTPKNLEQVRDGVSDVHLFHFMANEDFRKLAGAIDGVAFSSGHWAETADHINEVFAQNRA